MRFKQIIMAGLFCVGSISAAKAEPTEIVVRVMAKDAKFIGTETGGAEITLRDADTGEVVIEDLYASDLAYLQDLYNRLNGSGSHLLHVICPHCQQPFEVEPDQPGES